MGDVTALIERAHAGDSLASAALFTEVYNELKRIAGRQVRKLRGTPMHTTTLVHEAYFRLAKPETLTMRNREHFYSVAGRAMRQLLLDEVRAKSAFKRSDELAISLEDSDVAVAPSSLPDEEILALDQALAQLAEVDPHLVHLVELRFFAGLELAEISTICDRSERSLKRDWRKARAFLHATLGAPTSLSDDAFA